MKSEDRLYFNRLLSSWLEELTAKTTGKPVSENAEQLPDILDRASFEIDRDLDIRMREREYRLIHKIRRTLQNIEDGSFGICEECGEEIPVARLKARPVTTLCIACKQEQETAERMTA